MKWKYYIASRLSFAFSPLLWFKQVKLLSTIISLGWVNMKPGFSYGIGFCLVDYFYLCRNTLVLVEFDWLSHKMMTIGQPFRICTPGVERYSKIMWSHIFYSLSPQNLENWKTGFLLVYNPYIGNSCIFLIPCDLLVGWVERKWNQQCISKLRYNTISKSLVRKQVKREYKWIPLVLWHSWTWTRGDKVWNILIRVEVEPIHTQIGWC